MELSLNILALRSRSSSSTIRFSKPMMIFRNRSFSANKRMTCSSKVIFSPKITCLFLPIYALQIYVFSL